MTPYCRHTFGRAPKAHHQSCKSPLSSPDPPKGKNSGLEPDPSIPWHILNSICDMLASRAYSLQTHCPTHLLGTSEKKVCIPNIKRPVDIQVEVPSILVVTL